MKARALMVAGTASHVGKSWFTTAICRSLARKGLRVAPFKAQNMSNNSYPCAAGGEIGRAQIAQAQACYQEPEPDMNPILLKPNSDTGSQVVVNGKVWRTLSARDYYQQFPYLLTQVLAAYERLSSRHDFIVCEGAGSITELNLKATDLVNLGLATRLDIPVLLTADIDRGGVFASVAGTFTLLEDHERALVRSFAINRFRGDPALFATGANMLEQRTGKPCLGVFPYLKGVTLDAEDSVSFTGGNDSDIAIIALPHISNHTDFQLIPNARHIAKPIDQHFTTVILPGTKNTLGDLDWLRSTGLADWVLHQHSAGANIIGICGGYQMLCERIDDPHAQESNWGGADGLALLPGRTVLAKEKITRRVQARTSSGIAFEAYEIHLGETTRPLDEEPFAILQDGTTDGIRQDNVIGTYLHGALENAAVLSELLRRTVEPAPTRNTTYNALADWFETNINQKLFEDLYLC